jgi:two-component system, NtrC family, response regulator AtoC
MDDMEHYNSNFASESEKSVTVKDPIVNTRSEDQRNVICSDSPGVSTPDDLISRMIVGKSAAIQHVIQMLRQVASYPSTTVLLQGESGTGKDVVAQAIHALSSRAAHQFVPINCAAIPEPLLESELFGVEAGAYTDAKVSREGHIWRAHHGSLFLDEIGSMPLFLQAKLLRFLETQRFHRVGGTREMHVDLRVISATNVDLQTAVAQRCFRDDLFYRLNVVTIYLPPLRARREDIEPLVAHFLRIYNAGSGESLSISKDAMDYLLRHPWPGNIRQLHSAIEHGRILCDRNVIEPKHLPLDVRNTGKSANLHLREVQQQLHLPPDGLDLPIFLRDIEATFIQEALERCNGNQVRAASLLSLTRDQLRYRLQR